MELYESLFIIRPSVSDEETNALIEKMKAVRQDRRAIHQVRELGQKEAGL